MRPAKDIELVQIVDAALASASSRSLKSDGTSWLACRPGCTPCCHGVFKISALDAERLHAAMLALESADPAKAQRILARAKAFTEHTKSIFPGDPGTGVLSSDEKAWDTFANLPEIDVPCPVLNAESGICELYAGRPLTCRIFGPPIRSEQGIGLCELCYVGAEEQTILDGQMFLTHGPLEAELDEELGSDETVIAWALASRAATKNSY